MQSSVNMAGSATGPANYHGYSTGGVIGRSMFAVYAQFAQVFTMVGTDDYCRIVKNALGIKCIQQLPKMRFGQPEFEFSLSPI